MNQAPLYVYAYDFTLWAHRVALRASPEVQGTGLPTDLAGRARAFLGATSLALTFREPRARHLRAADEALAQLRPLLRVGEALGWLSTGAVLEGATMLDSAGKLIGGWRKRVGRLPQQSTEA